MTVFAELTLVLVAVVAVSFLMRALKQPLVVGYILAGIAVGPLGLNLVHSHETLELFSKIGITILLFIVGLHLSPRVIKEVGSVSAVTGIGQVVFTATVGFLISLLLGIPTIAAIYVAIALTFSSTIIILKLLSDKRQTQTLYGKIAIGFLLVQDVVATIILIGISAISPAEGMGLIPSVSLLLLKSLGLLVGLFITSQWLLPKITYYAGKSQELLFIFSLTWGLGLAVLFQKLGLSIEIGALIAGVTLSSLAYAEEISSKLRPLRDFFIILFFITLGSTMTFSSVSTMILPVILLSLFVLVGNPVIVIILMNLLGYHKRTGFMAGLTVAQISEFSLILATLGFQMGHLSQEVVTMITLVGLITIAGSTYLILYAERLYPVIEKLLAVLELRKNISSSREKGHKVEIMLFGCERAGDIFRSLSQKYGYQVGVVDYNPELEQRYLDANIEFFYGDAQNAEFLTELPLNYTKLAISSIPNLEANLLITKFLKANRKNISVLVIANTEKEAEKLTAAGADYVVLPHEQAARHIVRLVARKGINRSAFA